MSGKYYDITVSRMERYKVRVLADNADDAKERAFTYGVHMSGVEDLGKVCVAESVKMSVPQEHYNPDKI